MKYACIFNFSSSSYDSHEGQDFIILYLIPSTYNNAWNRIGAQGILHEQMNELMNE